MAKTTGSHPLESVPGVFIHVKCCTTGRERHPRRPLRPSLPQPLPQIATARKLTVHLRPPASCDLEISLRGVKLSLSGGPEVGVQGPEAQGRLGGIWQGWQTWPQTLHLTQRALPSLPQFQHCSHFFQMKNISFCGCHPRNSW